MIQDQLKQRLLVLRDVLRRECVKEGVWRIVTALVIGLLTGVFLDYFFFRWDSPINTAFRLLLLVLMAGLLLTILYRHIIRPLRVPLSIDDMAISVEREFPQLNDSLISAVQLTRMLSDDRVVSARMIGEVARQAFENTAELDFSRVVKTERVRPILLMAAGSIILFLVLCIVPGLRPFMAAGLLRLANPFSNVQYPVRTYINVIGSQPELELPVPRNDALQIVIDVRGDIPNKIHIQFDHGKGYGKEEAITESQFFLDDSKGQKHREFRYEYNPVTAGFAYVIKAGDNQKGPYLIRAVDRPELVNLLVTYELPAYISDKRAEPKRERSIRNVAGAKAHIEGEVNKPMKMATLKVGDDPARELDLSTDKLKFAATIVIDSNKEYEIVLNDQDGLDNRQNKIRHKIWAQPDIVPRVSWKLPGTDLDVAPTAIVALGLSAEDDWGLRKAGIKFKRFRMTAPAQGNLPPGGQNAPPPSIDLNSPAVEGGFDFSETEGGVFGRSVQKAEFAKDWSLGEIGLDAGDIVEYWAEAYDWCPTSRKPAEMQVYRLRVLSADEMKRKLDIERLRLIDDLKVIIRDQENDKKQVDALKDHLGFGNSFENSDRTKVSEAGALQEEVRRKTQALQGAFKTLIGRYRSNGLDTPEEISRLLSIADVLGNENETKMPEASRSIAATSMAKLDPERVEHLKKASGKQEEILADLKALLEQMQKWAETEDLLRMTRELLLKQRMVTRLTAEFKDRLGAKKPGEATKEELGQVKGLEHEQRDCGTEMKALFDRMTQALSKMMALDKWVSKNIDDAIKIAQNTDATPENPDLATTGDQYPGIEDKMRGAQSDIRESFAFGTAGGKQKAAETGLERIITVLSRRREPDQQVLRDIDDARRNLQKILDKQRELIQRTDTIMNKQDLERSIAQAKQQLREVFQRQQELLAQTQNFQSKSDPQAASLEEALAQARRDLDDLQKTEEKIFKDTVDALTPSEREIARAIHELEALEKDERGIARESLDLSDGKTRQVLRQQLEPVRNLISQQEALRSKTSMADKAPDKLTGAEALKALANPQSQLQDTAKKICAGFQPAADDLLKNVPKESPIFPGRHAAARALQQAASLSMHAPDEMKTASEQLAGTKGKEAIDAQLNATEKLARAEEAILKALGLEHKHFEDSSIDVANRQADIRGKLDEIANRIGMLVRAAAIPEETAKDAKLAVAAKAAVGAMPELEASSKNMGDAADALRQGAPHGDYNGHQKASGMQVASADKIAKARAALQGISEDLAKDKQADNLKIAQQQGQAQLRATALQAQLEQLAGKISKAQETATQESAVGSVPTSSKLKPDSQATSGAAQKVGEAALEMTAASNDLGKTNPSGAIKSESKAIDALEDAREKLNELRQKVEELKDPGRRLERLQKELKDESRKLATEVDKLEGQMPKNSDSKASENIKNASNNMQNSQNNLGADGGKSGQDSKNGGQPDTKEAAKEQEVALSELEKALKALGDLAAKASLEQDPRTAAALKRLEEPQKALRDEVLKLQKKLDDLRDKTGSKSADKASSANQSAGKNQSAASSQMGQGNQSGAKSSEEEAEQDLEDALNNLEQFQQQMQQQNRNETLFQIEQELKKMLSVEKEILGKTQEVEKQRPQVNEALPRRAKLMVKQVFTDQLKLADATKIIVKKLDEAHVFQWVLQTAADDMTEASVRLDKEESGMATQEIQDDVIKKLGELIEALRKERTKPQNGGGGGGGGGKQPLVPPLAELKMLRIMQRDVNLRTKKIDEEVIKAQGDGKDLNKDQKDRLRRAAVKEGEISRVTNKIADDLTGNGPPSPAPGPGDGNDGKD